MDPDGVWRCYGHSRDPVAVKDRERCAAIGAAVAAGNRGVAQDERRAVLAGVVDLEDARARAIAEKSIKRKRQDEDEAPPIPLDSRDNVLAYLARAAGKLDAGWSSQSASAASSLANVALRALGVEDAKRPGEETGAVEFSVLPKREQQGA